MISPANEQSLYAENGGYFRLTGRGEERHTRHLVYGFLPLGRRLVLPQWTIESTSSTESKVDFDKGLRAPCL